MGRSPAALWPLLCCLRGLPMTALPARENALAGRALGVLEGLDSLECTPAVLEAYSRSVTRLPESGAFLRSIDVRAFELAPVRRAGFSLVERTLPLEPAHHRRTRPF